jgi:hypothetical protein
MIFAWDAENEDHIGRHAVAPDEAEYVVRRARPPYPRPIGEGKSLVWGRTAHGRYLQVVFAYPPDDRVDRESLGAADLLAFAGGEAEVVRVIHAMELTDEQKKQYRRLKGR